MVDLTGHLGMTLLWLAPAWVVFTEPKAAATFVLSGLPFGLGPDLDLVFSRVVATIKHHGIFHTVVAVTVFAAVVGPVVGTVLEWAAERSDWIALETTVSSNRFGFAAVWVAGVSHVFADMLSAPDIAEAVEPFWPLYANPVGIDIVWYNALWFNVGLLFAGIVLNAGLYIVTSNYESVREVGNSL